MYSNSVKDKTRRTNRFVFVFVISSTACCVDIVYACLLLSNHRMSNTIGTFILVYGTLTDSSVASHTILFR